VICLFSLLVLRSQIWGLDKNLHNNPYINHHKNHHFLAFFHVDFVLKKLDVIFSELAFTSSHLPWENMYFFYGTESLTKTAQRPTLLPFRLTIYAIAVQFEHLHKIRSPVEETCGFSLKEFDRVILVREK
jgi:hypothetical protein